MTQLKRKLFLMSSNNNNRKLSQTRKAMRTKALRTSENELFIRNTKQNQKT